AIATKIIEGYRRDPRLQRALFFAALEGHEQGIAYHRQLSIPVYESLVQYLARRQSDGALRPYNPGTKLAGAAGMAAHYAIMTEMFGFCVHLSDAEVIETFTQMMMTGIQLPAAPEAT